MERRGEEEAGRARAAWCWCFFPGRRPSSAKIQPRIACNKSCVVVRKKAPKAVALRLGGGFSWIQLMWSQIGVLGKQLAPGCWSALKAQSICTSSYRNNGSPVLVLTRQSVLLLPSYAVVPCTTSPDILLCSVIIPTATRGHAETSAPRNALLFAWMWNKSNSLTLFKAVFDKNVSQEPYFHLGSFCQSAGAACRACLPLLCLGSWRGGKEASALPTAGFNSPPAEPG